MFFSIIINTHNQHETIERCINSCLKQNFKKKYEIIIVDTSNRQINKKVLSSKKIRYFHFKNFSQYPEINQLKKIYEGFKKAKGKWFCLLDGDDFFKKNKLKSICNEFNINDEIVIQDECCHYNPETKLVTNYFHKKYKSFFLYKKMINSWPEVYGTSSISGKSFFSLAVLLIRRSTRFHFVRRPTCKTLLLDGGSILGNPSIDISVCASKSVSVELSVTNIFSSATP